MLQHPFGRSRIITWRMALQDQLYINKLSAGLILLNVILGFLPTFFEHIEQRSGPELHDPILNWLPATDMSLPIFIILWSSSILLLYRCYRQPELFLRALYCFIFIVISRVICISIVPIDPPVRLVPLVDPISNYFYGKENFVTKDLFYSGHCASMFMIFFCLQEQLNKIIVFCAALVVCLFILIQHVHYTMDVLAAPLFSAMCYWLAKKFI